MTSTKEFDHNNMFVSSKFKCPAFPVHPRNHSELVLACKFYRINRRLKWICITQAVSMSFEFHFSHLTFWPLSLFTYHNIMFTFLQNTSEWIIQDWLGLILKSSRMCVQILCMEKKHRIPLLAPLSKEDKDFVGKVKMSS